MLDKATVFHMLLGGVHRYGTTYCVCQPAGGAPKGRPQIGRLSPPVRQCALLPLPSSPVCWRHGLETANG